MNRSVPLPLIVFFGLTTLITLILLVKATKSKAVLIGSVAWMALQSAVSLTGFYTDTSSVPPRLLLAAGPPLILIIGAMFSPAGKRLIEGMDLMWTTLLHTVRVLVEINLYWLFLYKQVPALMTFEAGNLDIVSGLTAPIAWWAYSQKIIGTRLMVGWNVLCLAGLMNAVGRAMLSAPSRFQRFAFEQPTVAVLYFPFVLLISFIVPAVLFCHLAAFRRLFAASPRNERHQASK